MPNINSLPSVEYTQPGITYNGPPEPTPAAEAGVNFSAMLADAMREETTRMVTMASMPSGSGSTQMTPGLSGLSTPGSSGIEQIILASASAGEVSNAQIALFMLMMMMQSSEQGDMSMLSMMMGALLPQLESEAASSANTASRIDPNILMLSSTNTGLTRATLPLEIWKPAIPQITSNEDNRSPERYSSVVNQFRVDTAERYRPYRDGYTYCNIFVLDVTRAMGAHIPHLGAIAMCEWLGTTGAEHGWREVDAETAQMHANEGKPAVTSAGSVGHVQMVIPSRDGAYDPVRGVAIAQAGSIVSSYTHISNIYSNNTITNQVRYFIHE